ncbi:sensor histidine kinase [Micromonospora parastrephiae]|uniref:hypothetical protein n=1 Tax=Micromonospora parastrephiae TaxID=2806101 RepID=UPI001EE41503|nr:hypothetical protein [Micromonospora parastrephiae]
MVAPTRGRVQPSTPGGASGRAAPARGHGFGLIGLTERVRALGGTITAGPGVAGGWVLDTALPLRPAVAR